MLRVYTIGADTHCAFTDLAVLSPGGKVMRPERCPTTIRDHYEILVAVRKPQGLSPCANESRTLLKKSSNKKVRVRGERALTSCFT